MHDLVIAIDGPSGSGKSSTSRGVASRLGLAYLDTGSMYRAATVAWLALGQPEPTHHEIDKIVRGLSIDVVTDPDAPAILLNGRDISEEIREPVVATHVSKIATVPGARAMLTERMRQIITDHDRRIVVEGRDITTVVAPDAEVRVLLVASSQARMQRRAAETKTDLSEEELADQIVRRDQDDSTVSEFAKPAPGVHVIDSTGHTLEEVIDQVCDLVPAEWKS